MFNSLKSAGLVPKIWKIVQCGHSGVQEHRAQHSINQPELKRRPHRFLLGEALDVDPDARLVSCKDEAGGKFQLPYEKLVIATGSQVWIHL